MNQALLEAIAYCAGERHQSVIGDWIGRLNEQLNPTFAGAQIFLHRKKMILNTPFARIQKLKIMVRFAEQFQANHGSDSGTGCPHPQS